MAKRGKYHKTTRFSFNGLDVAHYRTTEQYCAAVQALFERAADDVVNNVAKIDTTGDTFRFDDYPSARKYVEGIVNRLTANVTATIERGSRREWLFACEKNDAFLDSIMDTSKLRKSTLNKMQDRNLDALSAFQQRKVSGMNLSRRVWKYVGEWKDNIEMSLDAGLGEGKSAAQLARDVKKDLRDPNRLFRRVRGKDGKLHLSKNARAFHPGQGVYRSSVKNAQRLTRSEINMAYRESDFLRWQQLDFVVGFEIQRSNHQPKCKCPLCERLTGKYPKTFKFVGWHPQCMCKAIPILMDDETFDANELSELRAALRGDEYRAQQAKNVVPDVPDGFRKWMAENAEKQANWGNTPYFVRDNFVNGQISAGLSIKLPSVDDAGKVTYNKPFEQLTLKEQDKWLAFTYQLLPLDYEFTYACRVYGIDCKTFETECEQAVRNNEYWREDELRAKQKALQQALKDAIAMAREQAQRIVDAFVSSLGDAEKWIGSQQRIIQMAKNDLANANGEEYPIYKSILNAGKPGNAFDVSAMNTKVANARNAYDKALQDGRDAISKYGKTIDVSKLQSLLNENMSVSRPAVVITQEIKKEVADVELKWKESQRGALAGVIDDVKNRNVEHRPVGDLEKELTSEEIIDRLAGGDRTSGSCSSLAFAYAANRGKMDVLDFRGGSSLDFFSMTGNIRHIVEKVGGLNEYNISGVQMMKKTEIGKEYYLAIGRHAAIVRQVSKGKYEFLELQSSRTNGWKPLDARTFGWRFSARGREWSAQLCEVSLLYKDSSYRELMGYINTAADKQLKGASGSIK